MAYDLVVIGGGPAGYVAAIRAGQLGKKVAVVEKEAAGGTCLNWGCIPTKALLKNAELYQTLTKKADLFGLSFENLSYDWSKTIKRSRDVSGNLAKGIEFLFKKNKVDYKKGLGSVIDGSKVEVDSNGKKEVLETKNVIIATGCKSRELPPLPFNGTSVISSKEAMILKEQPKEMIIIGAGAIGVEFAYIYNAFGTKVTIIEMLDQLLPVEDDEVGKELTKSFTKQGVKCLVGHKSTEFKATKTGVEITVEDKKGKTSVLKADTCLVAIGVAPVLPGGKQPALDDKGFIQVDDRYQTNIPNVYAVGDISGPPWLAHTGSFEGSQCVEGIFVDGHTPRQVGNFPGCTYCHPQVASIGKTERALKEEGVDYKVGKFPFQAIGKAQATADTEGFVKLIYGKKHGELLGAHIIGDNATELIAEMGLALEMELCEEDIHGTIHAHPTLAEAIHEATLDADGHAIHF